MQQGMDAEKTTLYYYQLQSHQTGFKHILLNPPVSNLSLKFLNQTNPWWDTAITGPAKHALNSYRT